MSDDILLHLLGAIRSHIGELKADMVELKERLGMLGDQFASLSRRMGRLAGDVQQIHSRFEPRNETT